MKMIYRVDYSEIVRATLTDIKQKRKEMKDKGVEKHLREDAKLLFTFYSMYLAKDKERMSKVFEEYNNLQCEVLMKMEENSVQFSNDTTYTDYPNYVETPYIGTEETHEENVRQFAYDMRWRYELMKTFLNDIITEDEMMAEM